MSPTDDTIDIPVEFESLLKDLIRIPSITGQEHDVMDFAAGWLIAAGLDVDILDGENSDGEKAERPNLITSIGSDSGPLYVMNGHMDTVPVPEGEEWEHPPFEGVIEKGRLYGRGSLDMKGPCGAMMWTMAKLAERKDELKGQVQLHLVCDEEVGGTRGSGALAAAIKRGELPRPKGIISGELSYLQVRTAERGIFRFKVRSRGRSAHTARARAEGLNAIAVASRGVLALEKHIDRFHPSVGFPVMSVNRIEGGTSDNSVPSSCTFLIDWRLVPGDTPESILSEVRKTLDTIPDTTEDGRHLPVEYDIISEDEDLIDLIPANMTDSRDPFVQGLWQAAEDVLGCRPEPFTDWGGATDARYFRELEIPVVIFGPAGAGAHGANEYADVAALKAVSEIYLRTLAPLMRLK